MIITEYDIYIYIWMKYNLEIIWIYYGVLYVEWGKSITLFVVRFLFLLGVCYRRWCVEQTELIFLLNDSFWATWAF